MYRAVIYVGSIPLAHYFKCVADAICWIDSKNNNCEFRSFVEELDSENNVVDWFRYT